MATEEKKDSPSGTERWVKFDFENAPASALEEIARLQESNTVLTPKEAGKTYSAFIVGWSFEGRDFKNPEDYGKLTVAEYVFVMKQFLNAFRSFFDDAI